MRRQLWLLLAAATVAAIAAPTAASAHATRGTQLSWSGHTWRVKSGTGNQGQQWSASHTSVQGGILTITNSGGVGGGVGEIGNHTYGTYSVSYRWSCGAGTRYAILLWPGSGSRPEIDLAEQERSNASVCSKVMATWHPLPGCNACQQFRTNGDMTAWHTIAVQWTASGVTFLLDGNAFGHVGATSHVPMHLSIQTYSYAPGPPTTLQVASFSGP